MPRVEPHEPVVRRPSSAQAPIPVKRPGPAHSSVRRSATSSLPSSRHLFAGITPGSSTSMYSTSFRLESLGVPTQQFDPPRRKWLRRDPVVVGFVALSRPLSPSMGGYPLTLTSKTAWAQAVR